MRASDGMWVDTVSNNVLQRSIFESISEKNSSLLNHLCYVMVKQNSKLKKYCIQNI